MTADKPPEWMKLKATLPAIVLIEMDEITLELYQRELSKTFAVYGFTETEKVLETIKHGNIQAVVIEPEIQSGKGWELIRAIRDIYPVQTLPIVICSTLEPNNAQIAADVTKYLTKPILPKFLREKLLEIIEKQGLAYEHG
jgi:DNA-binding response OmpR family regulator